jgi:mono/diheme cytochrome c family protein
MTGHIGNKTFVRNVLIASGGAVAITGIAALATVPVTRHAQPADRGRIVYERRCAGCHGDRLQGQADWRRLNRAGRLPAPPLDGAGHAWHHSDEELFHLVKFSVLDQAGPGYQTDMPAFAGVVPDEDIAALVAYIRSSWPPGIQAAQSFLNPGNAGMPAHVDDDWRLPAECDEPLRVAPAKDAPKER